MMNASDMMKDRRIKNTYRSVMALALCCVLPTSALAATLGYTLTINNPVFNPANGNQNVPDFELTNTSQAGAQITGFQLSIGDTSANFDFVRIQTAFIDPGNDLSFALNTVGTVNNGIGDDILDYSFTGFDPGDVFRFEVDVDRDVGGPITDFRDVLFPTATAFLTFSSGSTLSTTLNPADPNSGTFTFEDVTIAPVPLPGSAPLLALAALMSALILRKKPRRARAAAA